MTVDIALRNHTPAKGEPKYVIGPNVDGLPTGEYAGIVEVNVPTAAPGRSASRAAHYSTLVGQDGPTQIQGRYVRVPEGTRPTLTLRFRLPSSVDEMALEPSARVKPLRWNFNGHEFKVEKRRTVELGDSP